MGGGGHICINVYVCGGKYNRRSERVESNHVGHKQWGNLIKFQVFNR